MGLLTLLLFLSYVSLTWGFSDECHMTIMAIAHSQLSEKQRKSFDYLSSVFRYDYQELNDPIAQATWFDFIKYEFPHAVDNTLHYEDMQIFGHLHYQEIPYYPENHSKSDSFDSFRMSKEDSFRYPGSVSALTHILRSLMRDDGDKAKKKGTCFSWTLQLRILTHLMGDLHQPLHNSNLITKNFPHGTSGGNAIHTLYKFKCTLHYLWDNDFLTRKGQFPAFTPDEAKDKAKLLMDKYPKEYFRDQLSELPGTGNFKQIALESHGLSMSVYREIPPSFKRDDVYIPSDDYVEMAHVIIEKQLALAGYRLGNLLAYVIDQMPDYIPGMCAAYKEGTSVRHPFIYTTLVLAALPIIFGLIVFAIRRR